jgi:hypothetical protein
MLCKRWHEGRSLEYALEQVDVAGGAPPLRQKEGMEMLNIRPTSTFSHGGSAKSTSSNVTTAQSFGPLSQSKTKNGLKSPLSSNGSSAAGSTDALLKKYGHLLQAQTNPVPSPAFAAIAAAEAKVSPAFAALAAAGAMEDAAKGTRTSGEGYDKINNSYDKVGYDQVGGVVG